MRSSSGQHFRALDHVRAVAAWLVFVWHFAHGFRGTPVPFEGVPLWGPLVLFDEGHVGVALFMTLSGYLFAALLDGKRILYRWFFWNRALRLLPLLACVLLVIAGTKAMESGDLRAGYWFLTTLPKGLIFPTWPNGGWSITVELHFYLLLPLLLMCQKSNPRWLLVIVVSAIAFRAAYFQMSGQGVQDVAYWTIFGRIDQFVLGIFAFSMSQHVRGRHGLAVATLSALISVYFLFDRAGGFYQLGGKYPSPSVLWVIMPTIEGACFALLIAWYATSFPSQKGEGVLGRLFTRLGEYSYSIYLLHFFVVFELANFIHTRMLDLSNFYLAFATGSLAFLAMMPVGYLSMRFIELPFLKLRRPYHQGTPDPQSRQAPA